MSVKVFKTNKAGKIEFTRCELEKLLNETYNEGYHDGENHAKSNYWTWTSPAIVNTPYYCDGITGTTGANATIRANTADKTSSITDQIVGICTNDSAVTPNNTIKVDICTGVDKDPETSTKVSAKETPAKTYEVKSMTYNMDDLAKTIDSILNGNFNMESLFAHPGLNNTSAKAVNDPMSNLAKELRGL